MNTIILRIHGTAADGTAIDGTAEYTQEGNRFRLTACTDRLRRPLTGLDLFAAIQKAHRQNLKTEIIKQP